MNSKNPAMRYVPLFAVVAVQILIIALAPSKAPTSELAGPLTSQRGGATTVGTGSDGTDLGFDVAPDGTTTQSTSGGQTTRTIKTPAGVVVPPGVNATGDTSHCVGGRQFDPAKWAYAPPCVPKFTGSNGGKTYRGAEAKKLKVIHYDGNFGPGVEEVLTAQGFNPSAEELQTFANAASKFINDNFELYGRTFEIEVVQGQCQSVPPQNQCLRNEFRDIIASKNPFAIVFPTSVSSESFDEMSDLKTVNWGGWFFNDKFNTDRRPYHWDIQMGGTQLAGHVADWYCKKLHGKQAIYAGEQGSFRDKVRRPGIISSDDPENKKQIDEFKALITQKCGAQVFAEYYYAQDLSTVEIQRDQAVQAMKGNNVTSILCFCELVAPIFLYNECEQQRYWPEHVLVGTGFMDADQAAQSYDHFLPPAPPSPENPSGQDKQYENAFGLAQVAKPFNIDDNTSARIWGAFRNQPPSSPYGNAELNVTYYLVMASIMQMAGPRLTPETFETGAFDLGKIHPGGGVDPHYNEVGFAPGDYTWTNKMREVYWSTTQKSEFNNEAGTYIHLNNNRWYGANDYTRDPVILPGKPR